MWLESRSFSDCYYYYYYYYFVKKKKKKEFLQGKFKSIEWMALQLVFTMKQLNLCVPVKSCCPCRGETLNGKWKIYSRKSFGPCCMQDLQLKFCMLRRIDLEVRIHIQRSNYNDACVLFFLGKMMHVLLRESNQFNLMSNLKFTCH